MGVSPSSSSCFLLLLLHTCLHLPAADQTRAESSPFPHSPSTQKFKIALCQLSVTADKERKIAHARKGIEEAAEKGAQLVLLPLLWLLALCRMTYQQWQVQHLIYRDVHPMRRVFFPVLHLAYVAKPLLATQTPKNGSARCEYQKRVASLYEDNPSIANKDLNHDPVALILGRGNRGRVKGMGDGVSKTSIKYSDPYKKALQKE
ncbi:hypothetical protein AAC387_Pa07g1913 [Persea americana]